MIDDMITVDMIMMTMMILQQESILTSVFLFLIKAST